MTSTSPFDLPKPYDTSLAPPGLITKDSEHVFSVLLLGEVVGVQWSGDKLIFYYTDGHKAYVTERDGALVVGDYEVPSC